MRLVYTNKIMLLEENKEVYKRGITEKENRHRCENKKTNKASLMSEVSGRCGELYPDHNVPDISDSDPPLCVSNAASKQKTSGGCHHLSVMILAS